ncbi:hypothetical protein AGR5A_Cc70301 [Agrobacterium genomosp. 5 str. CFBP 6626]|nr:hypothetical protein AGR5A_Cc70301 [Agrobacterium genomosp. 5 str. CFBP 6626]
MSRPWVCSNAPSGFGQVAIIRLAGPGRILRSFAVKLFLVEVYDLGIPAFSLIIAEPGKITGLRTGLAARLAKRARNNDAWSEGFPEKAPNRFRQQQKAEDVGNETGNEKQDSGDNPHGAIDQLIRRLGTRASGCLKVSHHADAAKAQDQEPEKRREQDERQCQPQTDRFADNDEAGNFEDGHHQDDDGEKGKTHLLALRVHLWQIAGSREHR